MFDSTAPIGTTRRMTLNEEKAAARKTAYERRKPAHAAGLDADANRELIGAISLIRDAKVIAGYMPIRTEVSPLAAMTILYSQERKICVPVIAGDGRPLEFREWEPGGEMVDGPFGAEVPRSGQLLVPDVLITPLLAFDPQGYRLGYGGGFYDRTFEKLAADRPFAALGFAYSAQQVDAVPRERTDWKLDMVVTERGVLKI